MNKLIITAAITGAETTKKMNPALPVTPEEQARDVKACVDAGASIIHLHVRGKDGKPSQNLDDFRASIEAIRASCDPKPIIQLSTGGAVGEAMEKRIAPIVELKPEMASLNVGSMNFMGDVFVNYPKDVEVLAKHFKNLGIVPEVEVYEPGHIGIAKQLIKKDLIDPPVHYQFVLGVPGGLDGEARSLLFMRESIGPQDTWAVAGIGRFELPLAVHSILMGGHVRVGLEDNVFYRKGELAKNNAQLVERIVRIANEVGREIATPEDARKLIGVIKE
jgi:3-keto-5-aminohexanoate cleavage enzyme